MPVPYLPIVRWKRGERVGIQNLSPAAKTNVVPLVVVGADQFRAKAATGSRPAMAAAQVFVNELMTAWGTAPIYVDAGAVPHAVGSNPIVDITTIAASAGAQIIPATQLDAPPAYQAAVSAVATRDGRGVALRVDLQEMTSAAAWTTHWPHALQDTDLVVDFAENITLVFNSVGAATIGTTFAGIHRPTDWRSITMAGSSMPGNFGGYTQGRHLLRRVEWDLWQYLARLGLPYILQYGDYTTVSPNAPPQGIAWGFPINARYTLANEFLICRGVSTTGFGGIDMDQQLLDHSRLIVSQPGRGALACWADARIDGIASGAESPGNLERWVQIGVNRHIELVRTHLP